MPSSQTDHWTKAQFIWKQKTAGYQLLLIKRLASAKSQNTRLKRMMRIDYGHTI